MLEPLELSLGGWCSTQHTEHYVDIEHTGVGFVLSHTQYHIKEISPECQLYIVCIRALLVDKDSH